MIDHSKGCANCRHTEATLRRPFVPPDRIPVLVDSHGAAGHTGRSDPGSPDIQAMSIFPADRPLTDDEPKLARWNLPARRKPTIAYRRCLLWFGVSRLPASMCYRSVAIFSFSLFFSLFSLVSAGRFIGRNYKRVVSPPIWSSKRTKSFHLALLAWWRKEITLSSLKECKERGKCGNFSRWTSIGGVDALIPSSLIRPDIPWRNWKVSESPDFAKHGRAVGLNPLSTNGTHSSSSFTRQKRSP